MATINRIDGPDAFREAKRKSQYGHNDWLWWRDRTGSHHAARKSPEAIKEMLLAVGTNGKWTLLTSGTPMRGFWWLGLNILRQARRGW